MAIERMREDASVGQEAARQVVWSLAWGCLEKAKGPKGAKHSRQDRQMTMEEILSASHTESNGLKGRVRHEHLSVWSN